MIQMADPLIAAWGKAAAGPQPFMYMATNMVRIEGVKVPNDRRYLQAMLQVRNPRAPGGLRPVKRLAPCQIAPRT